MTKLKVEYVDLKDISTYENNAKIHTAEQIEQIKKSIEEFGFNDPIAVWNNTIVEGHGRYIAASEMRMEQIPVIRLDDLTDEQRRAYTIVHNKLTMNTGFDFAILEEELEDLQGVDMGVYGFEQLEQEMGGGTADTPSEPSYTYHEQYGVIVICENETEQEEVYNKLSEGGYNCRVVAV